MSTRRKARQIPPTTTASVPFEPLPLRNTKLKSGDSELIGDMTLDELDEFFDTLEVLVHYEGKEVQ